MANNKKFTSDEVRSLIEEVISENACDATVASVEPNSDGDYCTVVLDGDVWLNVLNGIAKVVGDEPIVSGEEYNSINLFFRIPDADKSVVGGGGYDNHEEEAAPAIPSDMRHKYEFYDSEDIVIPGTEFKRSNTEQNEQIMAWMKETGHYPIVYLRLDDGVHVEVSDIYDQKVRDVLERGEAVGGDGRKYKIENPENIFPIGDNICVRATCIETGRGDVYGLDFFV
jgi:hypothetical protein